MTPDARIDAITIGLAQSGDRPALERILTSIRQPLYDHITRITGDRFAAEDILQETLFTICRRLTSLREAPLFRAWAYRIATRQAVRRGKRERFWTEAARDEELAAVPELDELDDEVAGRREALEAALDDLPPASQLVLRMHYLDELSYAEISEALEIPVGTVKSRASYGLGSLRRRFSGALSRR